MEQDDPAEALTELRERRPGPLELLQVAAGSGLAVYAVWALLLQPGFRRVPLRLQVRGRGAAGQRRPGGLGWGGLLSVGVRRRVLLRRAGGAVGWSSLQVGPDSPRPERRPGRRAPPSQPRLPRPGAVCRRECQAGGARVVVAARPSWEDSGPGLWGRQDCKDCVCWGHLCYNLFCERASASLGPDSLGPQVLAAHRCGLRPAVGYELNPWLVGLARLRAWRAGCAGSVRYHREDLWKVT